VNNRPQTLNLKQLLQCYIGHRKTVIRRRTQSLLDEAEKHLHILEGLLTALKHIDAIIEMIKISRTVEDARTSLMASYALSEAQANAILEMRLQRLTGLEQQKVEAEFRETQQKVSDYREILADERRVLAIIKGDVQVMKEKYGDDRRTEIAGEIVGFEIEDLIAEEDMVVTITHEGYIKRLPVETYRSQRRGGKGVTGADAKEGDFVEHLFLASTHDYLLFFTDRGKVYWQKVYDIPQLGRAAMGRALVNMLQLDLNEKVTSTIPVRNFDERYLVMVTEQGMIKKTPLTEYSRPLRGGIIAIKLGEGDKLVDVRLTTGNQQVLIATAGGLSVRFEESDARPMGRNTQGVIGVRLRKGDKAVGLVVVDPKATLLSICEKGYGKRTVFDEYPVHHRGGKGVINIKTKDRNGKVVGILDVMDEDQVMVMSQQGMVVRMKCKGIPDYGRATLGVRIISLNQGDRVTAIARVVSEEEEEKGVERTAEAESKLPKPAKPPEPPAPEKPPRLIGPETGGNETNEE
jgi:DNA gyrase subunit A